MAGKEDQMKGRRENSRSYLERAYSDVRRAARAFLADELTLKELLEEARNADAYIARELKEAWERPELKEQ